MPFYDYACEDCGPFTAMRSMAAFAEPADCPVCGTPAQRQLMSAPQLGGATGAAPAAVSTSRHAGGCGCCAPRRGRLSAEAVSR